jgi:hypothetical protein
MAKRNAMRDMIQEHNTLNGFGLVLVEFLLIAGVALFLAGVEAVRRSPLWSGAYLGIAVNAAAVCVMVIGQMRRGEKSRRLSETSSAAGREAIRREHPDLGWHTLLIVAAALVPFLLAVLTLAPPWEPPDRRANR